MGNIHPLTAFRQGQKLTRPGLARLLNVKPSTVWRWETGKRKVDLEMLSSVSEKTGIARAVLRPDLAEALAQPEAAE